YPFRVESLPIQRDHLAAIAVQPQADLQLEHWAELGAALVAKPEEEQFAGFEQYPSAYLGFHPMSALLPAALSSLVVGRPVHALAEFGLEHHLDCRSLAEGPEAFAPFGLRRLPGQEFAVPAK